MKALSIISAIIVFISIVVGLVYLDGYYRAKKFNEITGKHVTTTQAIWLDLRIQEQVKNK